MPNETPHRLNDKQRRLPERLMDLKRWVEHELSLPEEQQVSLSRLDCAARSFLGEFSQRAQKRSGPIPAAV